VFSIFFLYYQVQYYILESQREPIGQSDGQEVIGECTQLIQSTGFELFIQPRNVLLFVLCGSLTA